MTPEDREKAIRAWWEFMDQGGLDHDVEDSVGRLHRAFRQVLQRASDEHLRRFCDLSPQVICLRSRGKVFRAHKNVPLIYLVPVFKMSETTLLNLVAHEMAHVVLGHHESGPPDFEEKADDLVEQWGFKRSYPRTRRRERRSARSPLKPRSLRELYTELNTRLWSGRLPSPLSAVTMTHRFGLSEEARGVVVRRTRVPFKQAATDLRNGIVPYSGRFHPPGKYWPARISVVSWPDCPDSHERQVLLHEMIHCHLYFSGRGLGHGPQFIAELERLASLGEGWAAPEADRYRVEETS